ncbi:MAG: hypothetical protein A2676_00585 [Candidatus Sungbacteria bacterium RIFCSPHIGHO2_01_FULL_51_22]|nr:MAG: hypothetical protein A2676_00585 [Candidatus Sungbacteria bacterium RIFCSPHIGHO2_01_FULL_51_22]OHA08062.1 MAG: hypothetical protein A3B29_03890 [Candidatus Sungbacteria bacterium RIFCSPLOWO2_01_FULL_51_34]
MKRGDTMHKKIGDSLHLSNQFGTETVRILQVHEYPDGGITYGFFSPTAGRGLLKDCDCADCMPLHAKRKASGEQYIGNTKRGVLIKF